MKRSNGVSPRKSKFSHIYVEQRAEQYPLTEKVLSQFPDATLVSINNYKNVFNRPRQDYAAQKPRIKLILAVKRPPFLYPVSDNCQTFGMDDAYYTTPVFGCPFDCDFCYLHGMNASANVLLFVNTDDFFNTVSTALKDDTSPPALQLNISYDTDLLAWEKDFGLCREWIGFARETEGLALEIRTRSAAYKTIQRLEPHRNIKLAWSLSPDVVIRRYEHKTPSFRKRLASICLAAMAGWPIRICLDPIIPIENWQNHYGEMLEQLFDAVPRKAVENVAIGIFRVGAGHLKQMKTRRPRCDLFYRSLSIPPETLEAFVAAGFKGRLKKEKIAIWTPPS